MTPVRIAMSDDAEEVARVLADGFHDDPVMSWVFQGDEGMRTAKLKACFGFVSAEVEIPRGATFIIDGGCACWTPSPGTEDWPAERGARFMDMLRRDCDDGDIERLIALSSAMDQAHPAEPHWYLASIATVRPLQGHGVGTALLRHTLAIVDQAATPAYLESSNVRNVPLYERHGFRTTGRIDLPGGPPLIPMWRQPGGR